jgi:hypothetical protein
MASIPRQQRKTNLTRAYFRECEVKGNFPGVTAQNLPDRFPVVAILVLKTDRRLLVLGTSSAAD